jgi:hypothetical protein
MELWDDARVNPYAGHYCATKHLPSLWLWSYVALSVVPLCPNLAVKALPADGRES